MVHVVVRFYLKSSSLWWFNYLAFALTSVCYAVCYRALHLAGGGCRSTSGPLCQTACSAAFDHVDPAALANCRVPVGVSEAGLSIRCL